MNLTLLACIVSVAWAVETIPADSIRPGMKGYGLSVFSGYEIERFEVEVIDVMRNVSPRRDMILGRLSGAGLERSGVIAGMSGSPVYVEGKLAGAVAYAWGFSKEPIAGITPIGEMLDVWEIPDAPEGTGIRSQRAEPDSRFGLSPLLVPVALSGYSPQLAELIRPDLAELGLMPVASSGKAAELTSEQIDAMLVPGAALGIALVDGDVSLSGIGTLTWREGNRILAFGHPMFQAGSVEFPMTGGVIHAIMPSLAASFKLFSPSRPIGTVNQDRLPAIGGVIGPVPRMIPVRAEVSSPAVKQTYNYRVARPPELAGRMAAVGLAEALFSTEGSQEDMTLSSEMTLTVEDTTTITIRHHYAGPGPAVELYRRTAQELDAVFKNRFRPVEVTSIGFVIRLTPGQRRVRLISCRPERPTARPGDRVTLNITMKDDRDRTLVEQRDFQLPLSAPEGRLALVLTSRDSLRSREAMRGLAASEPQSLSGLWRMLSSSGAENELVIAGYLPVSGLTVGDRDLPAPPPFVRRVVEASSAGEPVRRTAESRLFEQSFVLDKTVQGTCELFLEVRR